MFIIRLLSGPGNFIDKLALILGFLLIGVFSIIIHELSHGYVAFLNGDMTAKIAGRLSWNPKVHFEIKGIILLLLVGFGWAKPVPINTMNFKNYKKGMLTVSLAGVTANFLLAAILALVLFISAKIFYLTSINNVFQQFFLVFLYTLLTVGIKINLMLVLFNLLPVYPLDGYNVLNTLFPRNNLFQQFMIKYGMIILLIIIGLGFLGRIIGVPWLDIFGSFSDLLTDMVEKIVSEGLKI
ncbi:MAG: site-2 protease family protein [Clostridiales bacterium]|nr:site-2 protease family protein [Clostridiales bacterium]